MRAQVGSAVIVMLVASAAAAWPVEDQVSLAPGEEKFLRVSFPVSGVVVEPAGGVDVEGFPSGELFVSVAPGGRGVVTLLAIGNDRAAAKRLCIGVPCPEPTPIEKARGACPDLRKADDDGRSVWAATIRDDRCLRELVETLSRADVPPDSLRMIIDEAPARALMKRVIEDIGKDARCKGLSAAYVGATLKLTGKGDRTAIDRAVWHAFRASVGRVSFDAESVVRTEPSRPTGPPPAREIPLTESLAAPKREKAATGSAP
jgi:hypothetical protein